MLDKNISITIEIVAHYPFFDKQMADVNSGTFHAYWVEMQMDLRGCRYYLRKNLQPFTSLAILKTFDREENKNVAFCPISFTDGKYEKNFRNELQKAFRKYAKATGLKYFNINKKIVVEKSLDEIQIIT